MISLLQLNPNQAGKIVAIKGGRGLIIRFNNLGIREGAKIKKVAGYSRGGPVVISVNGTQLALGKGMASKILVEVQ
ncbi:MAG: ferrous iron transport protein A [Candidatus Omnitrophica bacterium]|nr:ferrous iron transport protein A [Candidatus Omnitrophota bacterium]MCF7891662.1 ferrous iron transport protein A [Candidatus Omnitrophota bacterium]MCF7895713.1 ferrous iron transport protein A [Candidatus Omnitrophota bacterium]MCF7897283.1 ferrous iron transport protein A [Candidatus Omnitrophota bacterium]MCF7909318.1 ferrous iron transport protein A [Candidatus Omnitrophota bacterium]